MTKPPDIRSLMRLGPVIPVIVIDKLQHAVPLARALVAGGVRVLELTLRTPVALDAVRAIAEEVAGAVVGVGTITRGDDIARALGAGAVFGVSPGLTPDIVAAARAHPELPLLPGVMTPTEVMAARESGFDALKLFPAQPAGGITMLKALHGPRAAERRLRRRLVAHAAHAARGRRFRSHHRAGRSGDCVAPASCGGAAMNSLLRERDRAPLRQAPPGHAPAARTRHRPGHASGRCRVSPSCRTPLPTRQRAT